MPQKTWAVGEEVLAADFNAYVQNQVVPQFTNTAQRDAQYTSPPLGALCITTDTLTTWIWTGAAWAPREPERVLYENTTTAQLGAAFTAEVVLLTTSSLQLVAGRRYYWRFSARLQNTAAAGGIVTIRLRVTNLAGANLQTGEIWFPAAIALTGAFFGPLVNPPAGAVSFVLTGQSSSGSGTVQGFANAPNSLQILERTP